MVPPAQSGYGDSVVREQVPYELGGSVCLDYLICMFPRNSAGRIASQQCLNSVANPLASYFALAHSMTGMKGPSADGIGAAAR